MIDKWCQGETECLIIGYLTAIRKKYIMSFPQLQGRRTQNGSTSVIKTVNNSIHHQDDAHFAIIKQ